RPGAAPAPGRRLPPARGRSPPAPPPAPPAPPSMADRGVRRRGRSPCPLPFPLCGRPAGPSRPTPPPQSYRHAPARSTTRTRRTGPLLAIVLHSNHLDRMLIASGGEMDLAAGSRDAEAEQLERDARALLRHVHSVSGSDPGVEILGARVADALGLERDYALQVIRYLEGAGRIRFSEAGPSVSLPPTGEPERSLAERMGFTQIE